VCLILVVLSKKIKCIVTARCLFFMSRSKSHDMLGINGVFLRVFLFFLEGRASAENSMLLFILLVKLCGISHSHSPVDYGENVESVKT